MLTSVTAIRFDKAVASGRTKPAILACVGEDGAEVELVVKFAAGCEMKQRSLVAEAVTALLAADLDLPVPEPFLVQVDADFAGIIPDAAIQQRARESVGWNFGSKKLPPGFATIPTDRPVPQAMLPVAAEILAFDTFIANPNCLTNGRQLAIYDHELAFFTEGIIGWKPPWEAGAIDFPRGQGPKVRHVFLEGVRGTALDLRRLAGAFDAITPARLAEYRAALPADWQQDGRAITRMLDYVAALKQNLERAINQLTLALR